MRKHEYAHYTDNSALTTLGTTFPSTTHDHTDSTSNSHNSYQFLAGHPVHSGGQESKLPCTSASLMAASTLQTKVISSEKFVESCGAVLFDLSNLADIKVCLIQLRDDGTWHFPKGRRNQGETRKDAAVREVMEETGFRCRLLPVTMPTRATRADAHADVLDKAIVCEDLTEPFMCHVRTLKNGKGTKFIWWYIAVLEEDGDQAKLPGEDKWNPVFSSCESALNTLTFENDRQMLKKALDVLQITFAAREPSASSTQRLFLGNLACADVKIQSKLAEPVSKKAAKRAVKAAKALQRCIHQVELGKKSPIQAGQTPGSDCKETKSSKRTPSQEEARKCRKRAKRHQRTEEKAT